MLVNKHFRTRSAKNIADLLNWQKKLGVTVCPPFTKVGISLNKPHPHCHKYTSSQAPLVEIVYINFV